MDLPQRGGVWWVLCCPLLIVSCLVSGCSCSDRASVDLLADDTDAADADDAADDTDDAADDTDDDADDTEIADTMMGKTSVASTSAGNDVTLTFTFASAVLSETPTVDVTGPDSAELTVSGCAFNDGRTSYACTVSGIDGCTTFSDYTVTVTGTGGFTTTFNSGDDEFDNSATLDTCWVQGSFGGTATISDGNLEFSLLGVDGGNMINYDKDISSAANYAFLTNISSMEYPTSGGGGGPDYKPQICSGPYSAGNADHVTACLGYDGIGQVWWLDGKNMTVLMTRPTGDYGHPSPTGPPFYACFVRHDNIIKTYVSFDGLAYTQLASSNMRIAFGAGTVEDVVEAGGSWADLVTLVGWNGYTDTTIAGDYGYARFRTTGITGESSADCPAL